MPRGSECDSRRDFSNENIVNQDLSALGFVEYHSSERFPRRGEGGFLGWGASRGRKLFFNGHGIGIKAVENVEQIAGAEGEADAGNIFLDEFLRVDADHFAAGIQQWTAAVARIDRRVRLN